MGQYHPGEYDKESIKSIDLPEGWLRQQMVKAIAEWEAMDPAAKRLLEPLKHINDEIKMPKEKTGPVSTKHYNPMEEPTRYPLELTQDGHICLWDEEGKYKWTIAMFVPACEGGFELQFVGDRPLDKRVKWKHLRKIVKQFHETAKETE